MNKRFKLILSVLVATAAILMLWQLTTRGTKTTSNATLHVIVKDENFLPVKIEGAESTVSVSSVNNFIDLSPGKYKLTFFASGAKDIKTEVTLASGLTTDIELVFEKDTLSAKEILKREFSSDEKLFDLENGYKIRDAKFYLNDTWLTGTLVTTELQTDGELVVMEKQTQGWEIIYSGTSYRKSTLISNNVPPEVVEAVGP